MTEVKVNEVIKSVYGNNYFAVKNEKGENVYKVLHTVGINGALGSARGWCYEHGDHLLFRFVWGDDARSFAKKAEVAGKVSVDMEFDWWVVKVYPTE
jgi:hypothetical protein